MNQTVLFGMYSIRFISFTSTMSNCVGTNYELNFLEFFLVISNHRPQRGDFRYLCSRSLSKQDLKDHGNYTNPSSLPREHKVESCNSLWFDLGALILALHLINLQSPNQLKNFGSDLGLQILGNCRNVAIIKPLNPSNSMDCFALLEKRVLVPIISIWSVLFNTLLHTLAKSPFHITKISI